MGIGDKLNFLLEQRGRNINELATTINVSAQTLYSISKRNNTKVDLDVLQKVADELSVTLDYFCTDNADSTESLVLTPTERDLLLSFRSLSDQGQDYILQTMDLVKDKYKKDNSSSDMAEVG